MVRAGTTRKDEKAAWYMNAGRLGEQFCKLEISKPVEIAETPSPSTTERPEDGLMWYKYIPRSGAVNKEEKRGSDAEYAVFLPDAEEAKVEKKLEKVWKGTGNISFDKLDGKRLPTLHHVVERLAEIPVYEVAEAKIVMGKE